MNKHMFSLAAKDSQDRSVVPADDATKHVTGRTLADNLGDGSKAIATTSSERLAITVSGGIAQRRPGEPCEERLDRAFSEAKGAGRDRISVAP